MKLKLNKKKLKNLSKDNKVLPMEMTPQIGGGRGQGVCSGNVRCQMAAQAIGDGDHDVAVTY